MKSASAKKRFLNAVVDFWITPLLISFLLNFLLKVGYLPYADYRPTLVIITVALVLVFECLYGRSLGKLVSGTIVVTEKGEKPSLKQLVVRNFARFIPFEALSYLTKNPVGWHDLLSKTQVVDVKGLTIKKKSPNSSEPSRLVILIIIVPILLLLTATYYEMKARQIVSNMDYSILYEQNAGSSSHDRQSLSDNQYTMLNQQCNERKEHISNNLTDEISSLNLESQSQKLLIASLTNKIPFLAFYSESLDSCLMVHRGENESYIIFNDTANEVIDEIPELEIDRYQESIDELSNGRVDAI